MSDLARAEDSTLPQAAANLVALDLAIKFSVSQMYAATDLIRPTRRMVGRVGAAAKRAPSRYVTRRALSRDVSKRTQSRDVA